MTKYIYPYNDKSKSVVNLATAMGIKRIKRMNSAFVGGAGKEVINWGSCTSNLQRSVSHKLLVSFDYLMFFDYKTITIHF